MEDRINKIIMDHLRLTAPPLASNRLGTDFDTDSLDEIEIIMAIEEEFNIELSDDDAENFVTIADLYAFVANHTSD